jgi:hypothetical protein
MSDLGPAEYLRVAVLFERRATAATLPGLKANLLKLADMHRELAAQAEQRRLFGEGLSLKRYPKGAFIGKSRPEFRRAMVRETKGPR